MTETKHPEYTETRPNDIDSTHRLIHHVTTRSLGWFYETTINPPPTQLNPSTQSSAQTPTYKSRSP